MQSIHLYVNTNKGNIVSISAHNRLVGGSTPPGPTIHLKGLNLSIRLSPFCFFILFFIFYFIWGW